MERVRAAHRHVEGFSGKPGGPCSGGEREGKERCWQTLADALYAVDWLFMEALLSTEDKLHDGIRRPVRLLTAITALKAFSKSTRL